MNNRYLLVSVLMMMVCSLVSQITIDVISTTPGQSKGVIAVTVQGDAAAFTIEIIKDGVKQNQELPKSGLIRFDQLSGGTYLVRVLDKIGCFREEEVVVEEKNFTCIDISVVVSDFNHVSICGPEECVGADDQCDDGSIQLSISEGVAYSISWSGPQGFSSVLTSISNLKPGVYKYILTSDVDPTCIVTESVSISICTEYGKSGIFKTAGDCRIVDQVPSLNPEAYKKDPRIVGATSAAICDGSFDVDLLFNKDLSQYHWEGPNGEKLSGEDQVDLCPGVYFIEVDNGCEEPIRYPIEIPDCSLDPPQVVLRTPIRHTCPGVSFGKISVMGEGGTPDYNFEWSNGISGSIINDVPAGIYSVTVTDKYGCSTSMDFEVTDEIIPGSARTQMDPCILEEQCHGRFTGKVIENYGCSVEYEDFSHVSIYCNDEEKTFFGNDVFIQRLDFSNISNGEIGIVNCKNEIKWTSGALNCFESKVYVVEDGPIPNSDCIYYGIISYCIISTDIFSLLPGDYKTVYLITAVDDNHSAVGVMSNSDSNGDCTYKISNFRTGVDYRLKVRCGDYEHFNCDILGFIQPNSIYLSNDVGRDYLQEISINGVTNNWEDVVSGMKKFTTSNSSCITICDRKDEGIPDDCDDTIDLDNDGYTQCQETVVQDNDPCFPDDSNCGGNGRFRCKVDVNGSGGCDLVEYKYNPSTGAISELIILETNVACGADDCILSIIEELQKDALYEKAKRCKRCRDFCIADIDADGKCELIEYYKPLDGKMPIYISSVPVNCEEVLYSTSCAGLQDLEFSSGLNIEKCVANACCGVDCGFRLICRDGTCDNDICAFTATEGIRHTAVVGFEENINEFRFGYCAPSSEQVCFKIFLDGIAYSELFDVKNVDCSIGNISESTIFLNGATQIRIEVDRDCDGNGVNGTFGIFTSCFSGNIIDDNAEHVLEFFSHFESR